MNQQVAIDGIEQKLRAFAEARELSPSLRDQAQRYLARLVSPVRVTLFGRPSYGKSAILPAAIGEPLLPELSHPPTVELRYGEAPSAQITRPDGSVTEPRGELCPDDFQDAILAAIERPVTLLKSLSFLEVQADAAEADQRAAIAWAAPRTDIALWCSETYDETDQKLWASVPDQIKDHAYLILTGADAARVEEVRDLSVEDFHDVYPVDADGGNAAAGIKHLKTRLLDHARLGREADADGALLFIRAQEHALGEPARRNRPRTRPLTRPLMPASLEEVIEENLDTTSTASDEAEAPTAPEVAADTEEAAPEAETQGIRLVSDADEAPEAAPEDAPEPATAARPITRPRVDQDDGERELYSAGLRYIRRRSASLLTTIRTGDDIKDHVVAAHCGETLVHLSDMLNSHDTSAEPEVAALTDTVMEAESLVVLMENERGEQPALDALAILLQIRHDFESRLAA